MDETTPHLHLNLIPIADGRLCAKQLFDRKELQNLQTDFHFVVGKKWNLQRGKEGSQAKHLDTAAYKLKKISEAADQAELRADEAAKLKAENGRLEERLQISARDQHDVFNLYQKTEREKQSLQSDADVLREIREHAPDKLKEIMETVRQRKLDKYRPKPFKSSGNHWSK